jgi:zinc D-Ala-D-Ala carboxypeptidase
MNDRISDHFTRAELTVTTRPDDADADGDGNRSEPMPNAPGDAETKALRLLAVNVLEPVRAALGVPLKVTSGFRSKALNTAIKGAKHSQHMAGEAADVRPLGMSVEQAFRKIAAMIREGNLPADQAIVYGKGNFIHLSHTPTPRREVLRSLAASGSQGPYEPYTGPV